MEYQKIMNLLDNTSNRLSKFRTKNLVQINDDTRGTSLQVIQVYKFTKLSDTSLCNHGDAYILFSPE